MKQLGLHNMQNMSHMATTFDGFGVHVAECGSTLRLHYACPQALARHKTTALPKVQCRPAMVKNAQAMARHASSNFGRRACRP